MCTLANLNAFYEVANAGSFTHGGVRLNLSQSAASRQVGALEKHLGVSLFHRQARGLLLTENGARLYDATRDILSKLDEVDTMFSTSV